MGRTPRYRWDPGPDHWAARHLNWIVAAIVGFNLVLAGISWREDHAPNRQAFFRYLHAVQDGRVDDAYRQLCAAAQRAMPDYEAQVAQIIEEIGRIKNVVELRRSRPGHGVATLDGTKTDFTASIPIVKEQGHWRPCPEHGPLE